MCCNSAEAEDEDASKDEGKWRVKASYTATAKVHLARALMKNPEVMVLQRPFLHFDPLEGREMLDILCEHVRNRGFALPPEGAKSRRPRTVILSVENEQNVQEARERLGEGCIVWSLTPFDQDSATVKEDFIKST